MLSRGGDGKFRGAEGDLDEQDFHQKEASQPDDPGCKDCSSTSLRSEEVHQLRTSTGDQRTFTVFLSSVTTC